MRFLIRVTLEEGQMEIVGEADNAYEAIRLAKELQPALVILDHVIEGPLMGLEAAHFIKEACPTAKILMFSAHPISMEASQESAVDAFVSKADFDSLAPTARGLLAIP
ncbi:MAG: response regulator [Actinobacteria bacterium]|nr:response regulator [Actinomycetota bacterium]